MYIYRYVNIEQPTFINRLSWLEMFRIAQYSLILSTNPFIPKQRAEVVTTYIV